MRVTHAIPLIVGAGVGATLCLEAFGQPVSAKLEVRDDDPDGIVEPGQSVRFNVLMSWDPRMQFAGVRFDTVATADLGSSSNISSPQIGGLAPLVN